MYAPITRQTMEATASPMYDLNMDCLLINFRMLNLGDLARVADVCKKFRVLAAEAFKYEWKNKTIRLSNEDESSKLESMAILRNFGNQLRKVHIEFDKHGNNAFFKLIIDKCGSQLEQVDFTNTCFSVPLEKVLSNENIQRFNEKFKNLKSLRLENNVDDITEPECIEQQFPELVELSLSGYPFTNQNICKFVKLNPRIKSLSSLHCNTVHDAANMIRMINKHLPKLKKLGLWMHGQADFIEFKPRFLKDLRHLKIHNYGYTSNLQHLSISNERVEEMELDLSSCDENLVDFICQYKALTKLTIRPYSDTPIDKKFLPKLKKNLPKLAEVEIHGFFTDLTDIVHFVHRSEQLNKFTLRDGRRKDVMEEISKIRTSLDSSLWSVNYCDTPPRQLNFVRATSN